MCVDVWIAKCVSNSWMSVSFKVVIKWEINFLFLSLMIYKTSLPWTGALISRSIIILKSCDNNGNKYNVVAHL